MYYDLCGSCKYLHSAYGVHFEVFVQGILNTVWIQDDLLITTAGIGHYLVNWSKSWLWVFLSTNVQNWSLLCNKSVPTRFIIVLEQSFNKKVLLGDCKRRTARGVGSPVSGEGEGGYTCRACGWGEVGYPSQACSQVGERGYPCLPSELTQWKHYLPSYFLRGR